MADQIVIKKNFRYRLYPTSAQIVALGDQLAEACRLYNAAVQERRDAYHISHKSLNYYDQANQLKEIRANGDLALAKLRRAQRKVARRKRGGNNRKKAVRDLQRAHAHVRNQRENFAHKVSRMLVLLFGLIVVEKLNVKGLAAGMLAKSVNDAGWSSFITKLTYKAAEAGRVLVKVDPRGTSQRCVCGAPNPKTLSQRWHHCESCGLSVPRDHASALEILRLGLSQLGETWPVAASVPNEAALLQLAE